MPNIKITVAGKIATNITPDVVIVCGNSDYTVTFDLDAEWAAEVDRTARFTYIKDGRTRYKEKSFQGNTVAVPKLSGVRQVAVGLYAGDLHTTTAAAIWCKPSILCGDAAEEITPEEKAGLQSQVDELRRDVDNLKENGPGGNTGGNSSNSGQNVAQMEPAYGDISKFFIVGTVPMSKDEGELPVLVLYYSKTLKFKAYATLKVQGNSSTNFPKKNYTLKLYSDEARTEKLKIDFMGWGKQYKFVLKANWIDITHSRNIVGARLWRQICETRLDTLPTLLQESPRIGCVDGFPIKVYINGTYYGRYSWNIPKDKWAFNMDDDLEEHTVLCGESNDKGVASVYAQSSDSINGAYWSDEIHDTPPASVVTAWNRVLKFVNESTDEDFKAHIDEYIDLQSVIDYWCFNPLMGNTDAYGKNQLLITYDLVRWFIHSYDMDQFWGLDWNGNLAYAYDSGHPIIVAQYNNLILKLLRNFPDEITERYWELRGSVLSLENIINEVERWTDICSSELVAEDYAKTTGNGAFTGIPSAKTNNVQQIREWLVKRAALMDTMVPYFGVNPDTDADATLYGVTYNLTNCTSSNNVQSIAAGESYATTITANDGCTLDSVSVTHNGAEVTVTDGSFEIAAVEGDIVITAVASAIPAINLTGDDMEVSGVASYADGVFTINTNRYDYNSYNDGFNNYQVCTRGYALGRTVTLSYDYEVGADGDAKIVNSINLGDGTGEAVARQFGASPTTAGSTGTSVSKIENIEDGKFTMVMDAAKSRDYLGIKVVITKGNVTIRNLVVTVA